jgi:DNA invertase Pin-like site-specific DNA recombinase
MDEEPQRGDLIGYARISTDEQSLDLQINALREAGCVKVFTDVASGAKTDRPGLAAALEYMRPGDVLTCWKLDRVGRSTSHLVGLMSELKEQGFGFRSLTEAIDTTTAMGEFIYTLFSALAQLERSMIQERTRAGLAAARERGAKPGRKASLSADQIEAVRTLHSSGKTISELAIMFSTSRATVYRALSPVAV